MQRYNATALRIFVSKQNIQFLEAQLNNEFKNSEEALDFIKHMMEKLTISYSETIRRNNIYNETQTQNENFMERVMEFNRDFLNDRVQFITTYLQQTDESLPIVRENTQVALPVKGYRQVVSDSNSNTACAKLDKGMDVWKYPTSAISLNMRDDAHSSLVARTKGTAQTRVNPNISHYNSTYDNVYSNPDDKFDNYMVASDFGGAEEPTAVDRLLGNTYIQSLNEPVKGRANGAPSRVEMMGQSGTKYMGYSNPLAYQNPQNNVKLWADDNGFVDESDKVAYSSYVNKNHMRSYNKDKSDPFPWWRKAIQHRHYDRDEPKEVLGAQERTAQVSGYNMGELRERVNRNKGPYVCE